MSLIQKLKKKIILSYYIKKHINLKVKGRYFWGCCPFHLEKTPSFMVNDDRGVYHCFGCGKHGDIISFLQEKLNISFQSVLELLAKDQNIVIQKFTPVKQQNKNILQIIGKYYHQCQQNKVKKYIFSRNLKANIINDFQLGYSDNTVIQHLLEQNFSKNDINESGIQIFGMNDRFRYRLIIPILNRRKEIIGFSGRVFDDSLPKYLNSPETDLFHKSMHLYNEHQLRYEPIILVEGYFDVISLWNLGFNAAGIMGTSLTIEQVITSWKFTNVIYLAFDGDLAGQRATEKSLKLFLQTLNPSRQVFICNVTEDPDFMAQKLGKSSIEHMLQNSITIDKYIENRILPKDNNPTKYAQRLAKIQEYIKIIKNPYIKESYKKFFRMNNYKIMNPFIKKQDLSPKIPIILTIEQQLLGILFLYPEQMNLYFEELLQIKFSEKTHNNIKEFIINEILRGQNNMEIQNSIKNNFLEKYKEIRHITNFLCNINIVVLKLHLPNLINAMKRL